MCEHIRIYVFFYYCVHTVCIFSQNVSFVICHILYNNNFNWYVTFYGPSIIISLLGILIECNTQKLCKYYYCARFRMVKLRYVELNMTKFVQLEETEFGCKNEPSPDNQPELHLLYLLICLFLPFHLSCA
jgi:hypothetical protein